MNKLQELKNNIKKAQSLKEYNDLLRQVRDLNIRNGEKRIEVRLDEKDSFEVLFSLLNNGYDYSGSWGTCVIVERI